jgi:hypothetical protein
MELRNTETKGNRMISRSKEIAAHENAIAELESRVAQAKRSIKLHQDKIAGLGQLTLHIEQGMAHGSTTVFCDKCNEVIETLEGKPETQTIFEGEKLEMLTDGSGYIEKTCEGCLVTD